MEEQVKVSYLLAKVQYAPCQVLKCSQEDVKQACGLTPSQPHFSTLFVCQGLPYGVSPAAKAAGLPLDIQRRAIT